jgi:hypothetical protein
MANALPDRQNPQPSVSTRHTAAPNRLANSTSESPVAIGAGAETNGPGCPRAATVADEFGLHANPIKPANRTDNRTCSRPERLVIPSPQHLVLDGTSTFAHPSTGRH